MKKGKKILLASISIIALCAVFVYTFILPFRLITVPEFEQDTFGDKIIELYTFQTFSERRIGNQIVDQLSRVLSYTDNPDEAPDAGALNRYYYFPYYEDTVRADVSVYLNKVCINGDEGSVWLTYSVERFDENDRLTNGSAGILTRCSIERSSDGEWIITGTLEHP